MLVASLASTRDVMSASWPSLSFAAWAVGNTACSLVWRGSGLHSSTKHGYRDKCLKAVVPLLQPDTAGVSQGISFSLKNGEHHRGL